MIKEMKLFLTAVALMLATYSSAQDSAKQPETNSSPEPATCTVRGMVASASTGEPLKGARILLIDRNRQSHVGMTDSIGHFVVTGVPAGTYHFRASKVGFIEQAYRRDAEAPAELLVLAPGQDIDKILFRLPRAAVIIGRVTDEQGEPVEGALVKAMVAKSMMDNPSSKLVEFQRTFTNDLGEYRLYNLPPDSYYVAVVDSIRGQEVSPRGLDWSLGLQRETSHPVFYYPGVYKISEAQTVRVSASREKRIDISLQPMKLLTVSGRVLDPDGKSNAYATVYLISREPGSEILAHWVGGTDAQGNFEIKRVFPGLYTVSAEIGPRAQDHSQYWAEQRIEVAGEDVSGLQLQLSGDMELSGKVSTIGGTKFDFHGMTVKAYAEGESPYSGDTSAVKRDGTFILSQVKRTTNWLSVRGLPSGWFLHSALFGGQNVLEDGLKIADGDTRHSLEITVSPAVARIDGVVLRGDKPISGARVNLVPEVASSHRQDLFFAVWADQEGHFVVENVVPGSYRVLASDVENDQSESDDDSQASVSVAVAEKESKTVQIKLGPTRE